MTRHQAFARSRFCSVLAVVLLLAICAGSVGTARGEISSAGYPKLTITANSWNGYPLRIGPVYPTGRDGSKLVVHGNRFALTVAAWEPGQGVVSIDWKGSFTTTCDIGGDLGQMQQASFRGWILPPQSPVKTIVVQLRRSYGCRGTWIGTKVNASITASGAAGPEFTTTSRNFTIYMQPAK